MWWVISGLGWERTEALAVSPASRRAQGGEEIAHYWLSQPLLSAGILSLGHIDYLMLIRKAAARND